MEVTIYSQSDFRDSLKPPANFPDLKLIFNGSHGQSEFDLHRLVLGHYSEVFRARFESDLASHQIELSYDDTHHILPAIFDYMYTGRILISPTNVIPALHAAEWMECAELAESLRAQVREFCSLLKGCGANRMVGVALAADSNSRSDFKTSESTNPQSLKQPTLFPSSEMPKSKIPVPASEFKVSFAKCDDVKSIMGAIVREKTRWERSQKAKERVDEQLRERLQRLKEDPPKFGSGSTHVHVELAINPPDSSDVCDAIITILNNAVRLLDYTSDDLIPVILSTIAEHFSDFPPDTDLTFLPFPLFIQLVDHPQLTLRDEYQLYLTIMAYVEKSQTKGTDQKGCRFGLTDEEIRALLCHVQMGKFTVEQLEEAAMNPIIPREFIIRDTIDALKVCKGIQEPDVDRPSSISTRDERGSINLIYHHDFDRNGVIWYLGTRTSPSSSPQTLLLHTPLPFSNPHEANFITCTMSSILIGKPSNLTSREKIPTCTRCEKGAFICVDLGRGFVLRPTAYTLMHGSRKERV
ncbi:hypothetical protein HK102_007987 [Quaeritorhiza haematococci]|nr:hypothetical protein HK102_007987 [Quaeritorhiza haematococci]